MEATAEPTTTETKEETTVVESSPKAEEAPVKTSDSVPDRDGNTKFDRSVHDFNSKELMDILKSNEDDDDFEDKSAYGLAKKIFLDMLPSPENLADFAAMGMTASNDKIKETFIASASVDKVSTARVHKRRISITAKRCEFKGCDEYHFRADKYCLIHAREMASVPKPAVTSENPPSDGEQTNPALTDSAAAGAPAIPAPASATPAPSGPPNALDRLKALRKKLEADIFLPGPYEDSAGEPVKPLTVEYLKSAVLRERVLERADRYDPSEAKKAYPEALKAIHTDKHSKLDPHSVSEVELGQLFLQFSRLDLDDDGLITVADLKGLIAKVDPTYARTVSPETLVAKCNQMIAEAVPDKNTGISFSDYVLALLALRKRETESGLVQEMLQSAFWDLRSAVLFVPDRPFSGWLLKRGYALIPEKLNGWKRRYCQINSENVIRGTILEYFEKWEEEEQEGTAAATSTTTPETASSEPAAAGAESKEDVVTQAGTDQPVVPGGGSFVSVDVNHTTPPPSESTKEPQLAELNGRRSVAPKPMHQGYIPLNELIWVDFAPQSLVSSNSHFRSLNIDVKKQISFQVCVKEGRRYTLAAEYDAAIAWVCELTWYVTATRLATEWRANWGTQRMDEISIRDWINAGAVIAKMGMGKKLTVDYKRAKGAAEKSKIKKYLKEYVLTTRDKEMLAVCNLHNEESIEKAAGAVMLAIKAYYANEQQLKHLDQQYTGGLIGATIHGITQTILVWRFARSAKNKYNQNKYSVVCDSKAGTRHCAVCRHAFKFMTMRVEFRKYHCRCCGRVVCHTCSGNKVFMMASQTHERVCTECVHNGGPPEDRIALFDGGEQAKADMKNRATGVAVGLTKSAVVAAKDAVGISTEGKGEDEEEGEEEEEEGAEETETEAGEGETEGEEKKEDEVKEAPSAASAAPVAATPEPTTTAAAPAPPTEKPEVESAPAPSAATPAVVVKTEDSGKTDAAETPTSTTAPAAASGPETDDKAAAAAAPAEEQSEATEENEEGRASDAAATAGGPGAGRGGGRGVGPLRKAARAKVAKKIIQNRVAAADAAAAN